MVVIPKNISKSSLLPSERVIWCQEKMTMRALPFIFQVAPHNLMKVGAWEASFLRGVCDVALVEVELVLDIPSAEILYQFFLGLRIGQCEVIICHSVTCVVIEL